MVSISPRWTSEKLCADAVGGAPHRASASRAGTSRRNEGIGRSSWRKPVFENVCSRLFLVALQRLCSDDIVGLDPSGRADGETGFRARGKFARGLVVAAKEGGLCGSQIGLRIISLPAIGHRELAVAERHLSLPHHRRPQNRNRF